MNQNLHPTRNSVRRMMIAGGLGLAALVGLQLEAGVRANDISPSGVGGAGAFVPMAPPVAQLSSGVGGAGAFVPMAPPVAQLSSGVGGAGAFVPMAPPVAQLSSGVGGAGASGPMAPQSASSHPAMVAPVP